MAMMNAQCGVQTRTHKRAGDGGTKHCISIVEHAVDWVFGARFTLEIGLIRLMRR